MFTLFHHAFCPHSRFVRLILGEYGFDVRLVEERVWERREAFLALNEFGADKFEIVAPSLSIKAEPPVTLVDENAKAKGTTKIAEAYLQFLYSPEGQKLAAKHYFRPSDPTSADPADLARFQKLDLVNIDDNFGGWSKAQATHFADGGIFDQIYKPSN